MDHSEDLGGVEVLFCLDGQAIAGRLPANLSRATIATGVIFAVLEASE